jgi:hypothetical protein
MTQYPFIKVSEHGMSMLVTTPALGYTVAPAERSPLARGLWLSISDHRAAFAAVSEFWLPAVRLPLQPRLHRLPGHAAGRGGRKFTWLFKALVIFGVAVNLFGAITFDRFGGVFAYSDTFFPHGNN